MGIGEGSSILTEDFKTKKESRFKIFWRGGGTEIVKGSSLMDALSKAGYTRSDNVKIETFETLN